MTCVHNYNRTPIICFHYSMYYIAIEAILSGGTVFPEDTDCDEEAQLGKRSA